MNVGKRLIPVIHMQTVVIQLVAIHVIVKMVTQEMESLVAVSKTFAFVLKLSLVKNGDVRFYAHEKSALSGGFFF